MNVSTITITQDEALQKLAAYKALSARQRTADDERIQSMYAAVSNGATVINVANAFKETGLNDRQQPKLAIARGDWREVFFHPGKWLRVENDNTISSPGTWSRDKGAGAFVDTNSFNPMAYSKTISYTNTFPLDMPMTTLRAVVPHVPPNIRPVKKLHNYHILFEVDEWVNVKDLPKQSRDPFLLQRIQGDLFVVVAEWELTELEMSLLGGMRIGN